MEVPIAPACSQERVIVTGHTEIILNVDEWSYGILISCMMLWIFCYCLFLSILIKCLLHNSDIDDNEDEYLMSELD